MPQLQKAIPFPPPAVLQTTLPAETRVIPAPKFSTILPPSTKILLPVLPETVPLIAQVSLRNTPNIFRRFNQIFSAQVPDVVATTQEARKPENKECAGKEVVEISQVLPGYARSYAGDYVPNEVGAAILQITIKNWFCESLVLISQSTLVLRSRSAKQKAVM